MRILKPLCIAFSMYSKIPMPQFTWQDEDMRYALCFFPWVGAVIGGLLYGWWFVCAKFSIGRLCYTCVALAIPLLVTGGFHVDGFMDTMDAFLSYRPREKKLEILKDSHIGAFSVISLCMLGLFYAGALSEITDRAGAWNICCGFFLARCLSGIGAVLFPKAKEDGLLFLFASRAQKKGVVIRLLLQAFLCSTVMLWKSPIIGGILLLTAAAVFGYYYFRTRKELGGITGDTAGYFVVLAECSMAVAGAIVSILERQM